LRTEVPDVDDAVTIAPQRVVEGVALLGEAVAVFPVDQVLLDDRSTDRDEGRGMTQRIVGSGFGGVGVRIQSERSGICHFPLDVDAEGTEIVLLRPVGLLEAHVLRAVVVLLHEQGLRNGFVAVEHELIERRCEPVGLFVPHLLVLVLEVRIVGRQGHRVSGAELHDHLAIDPLAGEVRRVIAAVLRNREEFAACGRVHIIGLVAPGTHDARISEEIVCSSHDPVVGLADGVVHP
jgi:hypothetical protein